MAELPEWVERLPWGKIAGSLGGLLLAAAGGALHLESDHARDAGQKVQTQHVLAHWGEECQVVADSLDHSVQVRFCSSDSCFHFRVTRPGAVLSFFAVAGVPEIPMLSAASAPLLDLPGGAVYAQACFEPRQHGSPDHPHAPVEYGPTNAQGWQLVWWNWRDGCRLERLFHRPSGAWSERWRWVRCVH